MKAVDKFWMYFLSGLCGGVILIFAIAVGMILAKVLGSIAPV